MIQLVALAGLVVKLIAYLITAPLESIGKIITAYLIKHCDNI